MAMPQFIIETMVLPMATMHDMQRTSVSRALVVAQCSLVRALHADGVELDRGDQRPSRDMCRAFVTWSRQCQQRLHQQQFAQAVRTAQNVVTQRQFGVVRVDAKAPVTTVPVRSRPWPKRTRLQGKMLTSTHASMSDRASASSTLQQCLWQST